MWKTDYIYFYFQILQSVQLLSKQFFIEFDVINSFLIYFFLLMNLQTVTHLVDIQ